MSQPSHFVWINQEAIGPVAALELDRLRRLGAVTSATPLSLDGQHWSPNRPLTSDPIAPIWVPWVILLAIGTLGLGVLIAAYAIRAVSTSVWDPGPVTAATLSEDQKGLLTWHYWSGAQSHLSRLGGGDVDEASVAQTVQALKALPSFGVDQEAVDVVRSSAAFLSDLYEAGPAHGGLAVLVPQVISGGEGQPRPVAVSAEVELLRATLDQLAARMSQVKAVLTAKYGYDFPDLSI